MRKPTDEPPAGFLWTSEALKLLELQPAVAVRLQLHQVQRLDRLTKKRNYKNRGATIRQALNIGLDELEEA